MDYKKTVFTIVTIIGGLVGFYIYNNIQSLNDSLPVCSSAIAPAPTCIEPTIGMEFVHIRGGCFTLGDTFGEGQADEKLATSQVCLSPFYMGKYEVTQGEWQEIMGSNPSGFKKGDNYPVERVSWDTITKEFLPKLKRRSGKEYRLPSEAEWEYAARERGKKVRFGNGEDIADPKEINFNSSLKYKKSYSLAGKYRRTTVPVDSFSPNALGLYNMSGNVREWCQDKYHSSYKGAPKDGSAWESGGRVSRVIRGGSWNNYPWHVRAANRGSCGPDGTINFLGFRLVLSVH